jgi:hypothetical protein
MRFHNWVESKKETCGRKTHAQVLHTRTHTLALSMKRNILERDLHMRNRKTHGMVLHLRTRIIHT